MDPQADNSTPLAPPTVPGELAAPWRRSTWPTVIGIISIILGSLGGLNYVWQIVSAFIMPGFVNVMGQAAPQGSDLMEAQLETMRAYLPLQLTSHVLGLLLSVTLLVAGILLVQRRVVAVRVHVGWSVVKIAHAVLVAISTFAVTQATMTAQMQAMQNMSGAGQGPPPGFSSGVAVISATFGGLFLLVYPVFLLIWFRRGRIRSEVAKWSETSGSVA